MSLQSLSITAIGTPIILFLAMHVQRLIGPSAAGLVAALPIQLAIGAFVTGITSGDASAAEFGRTAASYLAAQIIYGIFFAIGMRAGGSSRAVLFGLFAYSLVILPIHLIKPEVAAVIGLLVMAAGMKILKVVPVDSAKPTIAGPNPLLTISLGTLVVLAVLGLVQLGGPRAGAFLAAIPLFSTTLAISREKNHGRQIGFDTMAGMIRGLPSYFVFAVTISIFANKFGIIASTLLATPLSMCTAYINWKLSTRYLKAS